MVFCFVQKFFSDNTRVRILIFFQNLTLGYMTKTLNQIFFFFAPPKLEYFFRKKKTYPPPPPFKLNGRSLTGFGEIQQNLILKWNRKILCQ